jgi:hypothetical protein
MLYYPVCSAKVSAVADSLGFIDTQERTFHDIVCDWYYVILKVRTHEFHGVYEIAVDEVCAVTLLPYVICT